MSTSRQQVSANLVSTFKRNEQHYSRAGKTVQMMEAVGKAPKVLDDKEVTLADIAKLAGIKEYVAPVKHSKKAD